MRIGRIALIGALAGAALGPAEATAADFQAFSRVESVCAACDEPASDLVALRSGAEVRARIIAENEDYLIVERYGEVRVVPKSEIGSVTWASGTAPSGLEASDQLILKNGHVLHGSIIEEKATPGLFLVRSADGQRVYVAFFSQIESVYRVGKSAAVPASTSE